MAYIVTDRKFYNQLVNGTSFSSNTGTYDTYLKANVPELIKAVITVQYSWRSDASSTDIFSATTSQITRTTGSFIDDGFIAGDTIDIFDDINNPAVGTDLVITYVSNTLIYFTGTCTPFTGSTGVVRGKTALRGFKLSYNLIDNNASKDFANLQDGNLMSWTAENVGLGAIGARSTAWVTGTWANNAKTGKTGSFRIKFVQDVDAYTQEFQFEHQFRVFPYFLDAERAQLLGGSNISTLLNNSTYKYIFDLKGGVTSQNPNEIKIVEDNQLLGNVGGFDETFNGGLPNFAIESISYADGTTGLPVTGIQAEGTTDVTVIVNSPTGIGMNYNHAGMVYVSALPPDSDIVQTDEYETNFIFDSLRQVRGTAAASSTIIQNLSINLYSGGTKLQFIFTLDFTTLQEARLVNGDDFAIMIAVDDLNNLGVYRTTMLDTTSIEISSDVTGLYTISDFGFYRQDMAVGVDTPFSNYVGCVEDTALLEFTFGLDTSLDANISEMRFKFVAYNTVSGEYFTITEDKIGFGTPIYSGATQQINLSKAQPYQQSTSGDFKYITVANDSTSGSTEYYLVRYPFRVPYMDYTALSGADGVFFDSTEANNGLNMEASHYDGVNNYQLRLIVEADVKGTAGTVTTYINRFPYFDIYTYNDDNSLAQFSSIAITSNTVAGVALPTTEILRDADTLIKTTFTYNSAISTSLEVDGMTRAEKNDAGGLAIQGEINSIDATPTFMNFEPVSGQTKLKITNNGTTVVFETLFKKEYVNLFPAGTQIRISSRIMHDAGLMATGKLTEAGAYKQLEDGNIKEIE